MPGDIPVVLSPKTDVQMESALFSLLTAFIWELSKVSLANELFLEWVDALLSSPLILATEKAYTLAPIIVAPRKCK